MENKEKQRKIELILAEATLLIFLILLLIPIIEIKAEIGENATVITYLDIGKSKPIITDINIENGLVNLIANSSKNVECLAVIVDYDTAIDILNATAEFFHIATSSYGGADDNNNHYTNDSCSIDRGYGDVYTALANCSFNVWYYANPGNWNCTVYVQDNGGY